MICPYHSLLLSIEANGPPYMNVSTAYFFTRSTKVNILHVLLLLLTMKLTMMTDIKHGQISITLSTKYEKQTNMETMIPKLFLVGLSSNCNLYLLLRNNGNSNNSCIMFCSRSWRQLRTWMNVNLEGDIIRRENNNFSSSLWMLLKHSQQNCYTTLCWFWNHYNVSRSWHYSVRQISKVSQ